MEEKKKQPEVIDVELSDIMGDSGMGFEIVETKTADDNKEEEKKD